MIPLFTEITCNRPSNIANGGIVEFAVSTFVYMSVINYNCNTGFTLIGNSQRTCQLDKQFDGTDPQCTGKHWPTSLII